MSEKHLIRKQILKKRNALDLEWKHAYDAHMCSELVDIVKKRKAEVIHCYLPMKGEVNLTLFLSELLNLNLKLICPKTLPNRSLEHTQLVQLNDLSRGINGTYHPSSGLVYRGKYDLIIVPGLAFTKGGMRLGYGGGYYDQFLSSCGPVHKLAPAYPFQVLDHIPTESHDVRMDEITYFTAL